MGKIAKEAKGGNNPKIGKTKFGGEMKMPKPAAGNVANTFPRMMKENSSKAQSGGSFGML